MVMRKDPLLEVDSATKTAHSTEHPSVVQKIPQKEDLSYLAPEKSWETLVEFLLVKMTDEPYFVWENQWERQ